MTKKYLNLASDRPTRFLSDNVRQKIFAGVCIAVILSFWYSDRAHALGIARLSTMTSSLKEVVSGRLSIHEQGLETLRQDLSDLRVKVAVNESIGLQILKIQAEQNRLMQTMKSLEDRTGDGRQ